MRIITILTIIDIIKYIKLPITYMLVFRDCLFEVGKGFGVNTYYLRTKYDVTFIDGSQSVFSLSHNVRLLLRTTINL